MKTEIAVMMMVVALGSAPRAWVDAATPAVPVTKATATLSPTKGNTVAG